MTVASSAIGRTSSVSDRARLTLLGTAGTALNPNRFRRDPAGKRATLWAVGALRPVRQQGLLINTGIAVVGNGNNDVGSGTPRKTGKPIVEQMQSSSGAGTVKQMQAGLSPNCGAMSQQGSFSYHGNVSSPQQLVRLVGCRDPKVRAESRTAPQRR